MHPILQELASPGTFDHDRLQCLISTHSSLATLYPDKQSHFIREKLTDVKISLNEAHQKAVRKARIGGLALIGSLGAAVETGAHLFHENCNNLNNLQASLLPELLTTSRCTEITIDPQAPIFGLAAITLFAGWYYLTSTAQKDTRNMRVAVMETLTNFRNLTVSNQPPDLKTFLLDLGISATEMTYSLNLRQNQEDNKTSN